jgi:hypothetical protein
MSTVRVCDAIFYLELLKTVGCYLGFARLDQNDSVVQYIDIVSLSTIFIVSELY